ncbi:MAG: HEAT repeat domain-containing protein [Candidatus Lokiarchaeota archaeon]|nr:HEAT repeat domain-containing protein [Candidatus Harpocratesius repetitus]
MSSVLEIIKNLDSSDVTEKKRAIFTAGEKKIVEAIPTIIKLLKSDPDPVVRNSAARALGKINNEEYHDQVFEALLEALDDTDYYVKANACWSLGKLKDPRSIPKLIEMVNPNQRFYSTVGDGNTKNTIAESEASEKLREEGVKFSDVIVGAIKALGEIRNLNGLPALLRALEDDEDGNVRCAACLAIGKIEANDAVPALINLLQREKYWYVRRDAIKALIKINDPRAADELLKKTSDMYDEVRKYATKALLKLGKKASTQVFKMYLQNPEDNEIKNFIKTNFTQGDLQEIIENLEAQESDPIIKEKYHQFLNAFFPNSNP